MDARNNSLLPGEARSIPIVAAVAQEEAAALRESLHSAAETLETRISITRTRIHRFPHRLRGIVGADSCHVVPSVVAIGPYHHGRPHLQEMEEVKRAAAHRLCSQSGRPVEEAYEKILSVAGDARRCYDGLFVAGLGDAEFATMMFVDACFLVWYVAVGPLDEYDRLFAGPALSSVSNIEKDIFMLENQIPWLVVQAIMEITKKNNVGFLISCSRPWKIRPRKEEEKKRWMAQWCPTTTGDDHGRRSDHDNDDSIIQSYTPPHLLGLLRFCLICRMPPEKSERRPTNFIITAFGLPQAGIKLAASTVRWFADMNCTKKPVIFGELSLSPLYLTDVTTSWLVNMAALESVEASTVERFKDGYVISSYLSMLATLMEQEEDVQALRRSGVVMARKFTNTETLAFFKGLGKHIRLGINYVNTLAEIERYMHQRPLRIAVHKFVYNNYRYIIAVMSIISVLVGIFKALYSLNKPCIDDITN
ncbi:unnamed protein product [Urochloa decumbens]|uniref:Uncharacterized protein n=1 Tax=Urochloa decumbens TaxID=240449 RepID=A0ABC9C090_9POAL